MLINLGTVPHSNANSNYNKFIAGTTYTGVAYNWGGCDSVSQFQSKMDGGSIAGDSKIFGATHSDFGGVDCSGFVGRCWGVTTGPATKYNVSMLVNISTTITWDSLKKGDVTSKAGTDAHVRLFDYFTSDTNQPYMYEATTSVNPARVVHRIVARDNSYTPMKYNGIEESSVVAPTVTTTPATNVGSSSATLNATITSDGGSAILERRFEWNTSPSFSGTGSATNIIGATVTVSGNDFNYLLTGLASNTTYYFRPWAKNSIGWAPIPDALSFKTGSGVTPAAPTITSGATASGTVNQSFSYQITASNSPTSYGASGLPTGVTVNTSTGLISGTPTTSGTFNATVTATNSGGTGSKTVTITIAPAAPVINGVCGSSSGQTFTSAPTTDLCSAGALTAVTGNGPWNWSCTGSNGGTTASCSASIQTWTVTPSAGAGGSISPSTAQTVNNGSTRSFTVTPNSGYTASMGGTCGGSPATGTSQFTYTTNAATANCTVQATFTTNKVDGVCGLSNNGTFTSAPTSNLCSTGTASSVTGSGPWSWTCAGSNGGSTASCSANLTQQQAGTLSITTTPVSGEIFVNSQSKGTGSWNGSLPVGTYIVTFGSVSGYTTPSSQSATVSAGQTTTITGTYTVIGQQKTSWYVVNTIHLSTGGAYAISIKGNKAYVTRGNKLTTVDLTSNTEVQNVIFSEYPSAGAFFVAVLGNKGYVTLSNIGSNGQVAVVNLESGQVMKYIAVGPDPLGILSYNGKIYVTNCVSYSNGNPSTVKVINTDTDSVVSTIPVGVGPGDMALDSQTGRIYVANTGSTFLSVIDTASDTVSGTISVSSPPVALGIAGNHLYASTNRGSPNGTVEVINLSSTITVSSVPVQNSGWIATLNGYVFVPNNMSNTVNIIDGSTNSVVQTLDLGQESIGIAADPSTNMVYVTNPSADSIQILSQMQPTSLTLSHGWNFISFPTLKSNPAGIETVLSDVSPSVRIVWGYDNQSKVWLRFKPNTQNSTLNTFESGKGYWIYMNNASTLTLASQGASTTIQLYEGWNLVGYSGADDTTVENSLSGLGDKWVVIWGWDNGQWKEKKAPNVSATLIAPELTTFSKGKAYWIKVNAATEWTQ